MYLLFSMLLFFHQSHIYLGSDFCRQSKPIQFSLGPCSDWEFLLSWSLKYPQINRRWHNNWLNIPMSPYESYPSPSLSSSSTLPYSVRFENNFPSMKCKVEREILPSSSFLPSAYFFGNSLHSMVYSYLLSSANFKKNICRLLQKLTLLCGVLILPLLFRLCWTFLCILVSLSFLSSTLSV